MNMSPAEIQKIQQLIQKGLPAEAAAAIRPLLAEHPDDYRLWLLLASIAPAGKKADCIRQAEKLAPEATAVIKAKAWLNRQQDPEPAISAVPEPISPPAKPTTAAEHRSSAGDLDRLRQQARAAAPQRGKPSPRASRRWLPWAALTLFLFTALAITAGWALFGNQSAPTAEQGSLPMVELAEAKIEPTASQIAADVIEPEATAAIPLLSPTPTIVPSATATPQRLEGKDISASNSNRERWTPTPTPTNTPIPTPTIEPTAIIENFTLLNWPEVGPSERWVDVNLTTQTLVAYEGKTPVMESIISSGRAPYYTVTGQFRIYYRLESQTMDGRRLGFDYVTPGVPWVQYFYGDFALHGAFWHNDFGTPVSHGCVNLNVSDAEWLYSWSDYGTLVNVHY